MIVIYYHIRKVNISRVPEWGPTAKLGERIALLHILYVHSIVSPTPSLDFDILTTLQIIESIPSFPLVTPHIEQSRFTPHGASSTLVNVTFCLTKWGRSCHHKVIFTA